MIECFEYLLFGAYNKALLATGSFKSLTYQCKRYGGKEFIPAEDGNRFLFQRIKNNQVFMAARYGANELAIMRQAEEINLGLRKHLSEPMQCQFVNGTGFFPNTEDKIIKFAQVMREASKEADLIGIWYNPMENYFVSKCMENVKTTPLIALEPWYATEPWSKALKDKRVLIVHPFADTIKAQYKVREMLFPHGLLPEFDLHTIKAVQTIAGNRDERFTDWFEALDYMYQEAIKIDFDIAILGCGAYGFPLASKIKKSGKQAIHLGGATQLLFGIKGKRWDDMPEIKKLYNEHWVRPSQKENVANNTSVEQGCYW